MSTQPQHGDLGNDDEVTAASFRGTVMPLAIRAVRIPASLAREAE